MTWDLTSERLGLRKFQEHDAPALARIIADPQVARTITANVSTTYKQLDVARARIEWHNKFWESDGLGVWSLWLKEAPGELLGWTGFMPAHVGDDAEILYGVGRAHWGQGYASEAALAAVDWLYATTGYPGICATVFAGNPASERIATRLGMVRGPDLPISQFIGDVKDAAEVIEFDLWRLESAADEDTVHEIGHRIGQMAGELLDRDEVWRRAKSVMQDHGLEEALRTGFEQGISNPTIMFFRADRPAA